MTLSDSFTTLRAHIDEATTASLTHLLSRVGASGRSEEFSRAVVTSVSGGKRFRALMAHVGYAISSDTALETVSLPHLSAALELYQASALVHDDIIDKADERRGMPTPHRTLADHHASSSWIGSSTDFGRHAAILVGDFLFSAATSAADEQALTLREDCARAFARRFAHMHAEVALGQYLDVRAESLPLPDEDTDHIAAGEAMEAAALAVVRRKSARYSVMRPLLIGAILGGLPPQGEAASRLAELGEATGIAFQLRDDELGVFGDPARTGKPAGDDLREGKRTVLLALAWQRCDADGRALLGRVLANAQADADEIAAAAAFIEDCGARAAHEERIDEHAERARRALEALAAASPGVSASALADLASVISLLTDRRA